MIKDNREAFENFARDYLLKHLDSQETKMEEHSDSEEAEEEHHPLVSKV